ncbi:pseudouridine synthase [Butyrivibrio sp. AE2032]|uniref:pseudouridine synthase n=1 Tax=Butyrivibrio sp. AE2032 TaxID=1458463 RepID=UPI0005571ADA|nr:pseudouridine synthase [Butyrivibrio sp. AE2032]
MRLNKFIASSGVCSRREADKLIESGRVTVNGAIPTAGADVSEKDTVLLDGKELKAKESFTYLAYYKPIGVTCTEKDAHAKRTVIEDLGLDKRVTYAGRLDKDSEGLLIMTDDGNLIQAMMKGSKRHEKEYEVTVDREISGEFLNKMSNGVYLPELDKTTRGCQVKKTGKSSFNIILTQGLNRQIRRMTKECGANVISLKRIRVMNIKLSEYDLKPGQYRPISEKDLSKLLKDCGL